MKVKLIILITFILSSAYLGLLIKELYSTSIPKEDPRETIYLKLEMKRKEVVRAIELLKEDKTEEAIIFLKDERLSNNMFAIFYLGLVNFETGKEKEGLELMARAIKEEPSLYDGNYPNNIRRILDIVSEKIIAKEELRDFRHLFESKLKGGCG